jgi:hypothetical protein
MSSGDEGAGEERGPKGGKKHQPGRGHDRKSEPSKQKRFAKRADQKRREHEEEGHSSLNTTTN